MTTFDIRLTPLPNGRKDIDAIRYYSIPAMGKVLDFPSFGAGFAQAGTFYSWAHEAGLPVEFPDHVTYAVACHQKDLLALWSQCYSELFFRLWSSKEDVAAAMRLKSQIEKLNPDDLFGVVAFEY